MTKKNQPKPVDFDAALAKLQLLRSELSSAFYERDDVIESLCVALLAREHILLVGVPGTAKSALSRVLCSAITDAAYFKWLLTKFSTPEELFGPVSFKGMENDIYRRITTGKLPEAMIAFLDEIFKANSAILNSLLTVLNEREFDNNGAPTQCPIETVMAASNELPSDSDSETLDALYDRFLLRHEIGYLVDRDNFKKLLASSRKPSVTASLTLDELHVLQSAVERVTVADDILENICDIRDKLREESIVVSDRRWQSAVHLVKAFALLQGRHDVEEDDLMILCHVLWREPDQLSVVREKIGSVASPLTAAALAVLDAAREEYDECLKVEGTREFVNQGIDARASLKDQRDTLQNQINSADKASSKAAAVPAQIETLMDDLKRRVDRALA